MLDAPSQILSCKSVGYYWLWQESFNSMNSLNQESFGSSVTSYTPTNQFPKSHQWATFIWTTCETGKSLLGFVFLDPRHLQCLVSCKRVLYYASCIIGQGILRVASSSCECELRVRVASSGCELWVASWNVRVASFSLREQFNTYFASWTMRVASFSYLRVKWVWISEWFVSVCVWGEHWMINFAFAFTESMYLKCGHLSTRVKVICTHAIITIVKFV